MNHLEDSLYNPATEDIRIKTGHLNPIPVTIDRDWSHSDTTEDNESQERAQNLLLNQDVIIKKRTSFFKTFFISSLLFFFVAVGFGVYSFFIKNKLNPEGNIAIGIVGSTFTQSGEELPLKVEVENRNDFALEVVDLIVEYSRIGEVPDPSLDTTEHTRITLGTIEPNKRIVTDVPLTLFGKEGDKKEIHFTLEYTIAHASTIFQKEKVYNVTLSSSPVTMVIRGGEIAVPNQPYHFTVEMTTNTKKPLNNMLIALNYPPGFTFESASTSPSQSTNVWDMGTLTPGETKQLDISGKFSGTLGDERSIRLLFGTYLDGDHAKISTNFGTLIQTVRLEKPFLSTDLIVNGSNDDTTHIGLGEQVQGTIVWQNNLPTQVLDVEIKLHIKGDLFDRSQIEATDGFYDSKNDVLIWNKNTINGFVRVAPLDSGTLYFTLPTRVPDTDGTVKNPQVELEVSVRALEDSEGTVPKVIESLERTIVRIGGNVFMTPTVRYSTGPIPNTGPFPPQINTETTYTVELNIENTINDYTSGVFRAKLPPNVGFTNVFSPNTEVIRYDEKIGEIIWSIGDIPQRAGIARTISFQLKAIPSLLQIGQHMQLLKDMTFTATDSFTKQSVTQSINPITTEINKTLEDHPNTGQVVK